MHLTPKKLTVIDGVSYTAVSHYTGNKDVNKIIRNLAEKQTITDMKKRFEQKKISA